MKLLILTILLGMFQGPAPDFAGTGVLLILSCCAGVIALLRSSSRIITNMDHLLLRIQKRPNIFDGFQFTGNPFILKKPFFAIYHIFLGPSAYNSYLVWPLKYIAAIFFLASIVIRLFRDEVKVQTLNLQSYLEGPLEFRISLGIIVFLFLTVLVLLIIESIRKIKWLFPLRLLVFLLMGSLIAFLTHKLFWLIVGLTILYLLTNLGRDFISRQKLAAAKGYSTEDFIYEPWSDSSEKT